MAKKNTIFKLTVIILLLFLAPIIILYKLSGSEKKSYIQDTYYEYKEAAYGEPIRLRGSIIICAAGTTIFIPIFQTPVM